MTDEEQAARLAAIRARRTQTAPEPAAPVAPARKGHPHIAAGARIIVTGLTASGIFGLTTVIAAANQPVSTATPDDAAAPATAATTLYSDPAATIPAVTDPAATALPAQVAGTVVLTIPPVAGAAPATVATVATVVTQAPAQQPAPVVTQAPVVTPAPTPPPTTAAPATTTPPPPTTTCTSANHKKGLC